MRNNLLVATHGSLAEALLDTAELIFGEQKGITSMTLKEGMSVDLFKENIQEYIMNHEGENILILVDLLSGSPFNSIIPSITKENVYVVTGVNLPMLLETGMQKDYVSFEELCELAKNSGLTGIVTKTDILNRGKGEGSNAN